VGDPFLHRESAALSVSAGRPVHRSMAARQSVRHIVSAALSGCLAITLPMIGLLPKPAEARPLDDVIESGSMTVFVYSDYSPYSVRDGDSATGIDADIGRAFGKALGVDIEFLVRGADENVDDDLRVNIWKGDLINRRAADVMMHVPFDRELDARNDLAVITAPYFQEEMALLHDVAKVPEVASFGRFVSTPIAVEVDTAGDFFLSGAFNGQLQQSVLRGRTFEDAMTLFLEGEVPALLSTRAQAEWVATQAATLDIDTGIAQPPMPGIVRGGWPIGIAVKHDSRDLGYALGDVVSELIASGKMAAVYARYGVTYVPPVLP